MNEKYYTQYQTMFSLTKIFLLKHNKNTNFILTYTKAETPLPQQPLNITTALY